MPSLLGKPLQVCSTDPMTGYSRDGYCSTLEGDTGTHVVCATMTNDFLQFTKSKDNNLISPSGNFPGLKKGNKWCLCALRWEEARKAGFAPPVDLGATNKSALQFNPYKTYRRYSTRRKGRRKTMKKLKFSSLRF